MRVLLRQMPDNGKIDFFTHIATAKTLPPPPKNLPCSFLVLKHECHAGRFTMLIDIAVRPAWVFALHLTLSHSLASESTLVSEEAASPPKTMILPSSISMRPTLKPAFTAPLMAFVTSPCLKDCAPRDISLSLLS